MKIEVTKTKKVEEKNTVLKNSKIEKLSFPYFVNVKAERMHKMCGFFSNFFM